VFVVLALCYFVVFITNTLDDGRSYIRLFTLEEIRENLGISQETFEEIFAELSPEFVKDNTTKDGTVTKI
jgi:hypothetical protein